MSSIAHGGTLLFTSNGSTSLDYNNNGVILVKNAMEEMGGTITSSSGTGEVIIDVGGTIQFDAPVSGNSINFTDNTGELIIKQLGNIASSVKIFGLQAGDVIQIPSLPAGFVENYSSTTGTLTISNAGGTTLGSLIFGGSSLPSKASVLNAVVPCFVAGTRIATPAGDVAVEDLRPGDSVRLHEGGNGVIQWTGQRQIDCTRHPTPEKVHPYRIAAHAFGDGAPRRDLLVSADHAVYVEDVLIPIKLLANGTSIRQVPRPAVTYHHIELAEHAVVLAEGLTMETLLPGTDRSWVGRGTRITELHPDFTALTWEANGYAPLVVTGPVLAAVRDHLVARALLIGRDLLAQAG